MPSTRRIQPSPIPGPELVRMKEQLATHYGSELWDHEGTRVLVVRVPRDEPDLVNDLEHAVEYLAPADLVGTHTLLLVGNTKVHQVPAQLLQDLMTGRLQFDRRQCAGLRAGIVPGQHRIYRAPEDPHRLPRMVVRVGRPTVAELDDSDISALVAEIGPHAQHSPYAEVRVVYLVADKDEVRIEGGLFFQDLHERWSEQGERRRLAAEVEAKEATQKASQEAERRTLLANLEIRRREVTAVAPLKRHEAQDWQADPSSPGLSERAEMYARLDALAARRPGAPPASPPILPSDPLWPRTAARSAPLAPGLGLLPGDELQVPPAPATPPLPPAPPSVLLQLQARLTALKFDVLLKPAVPGIDLAAERAEGYPQRLIAFAPDLLDAATAQRILDRARELDADMALVVCASANADAKRMFIATKARHLDPLDIATLEL